MNELDLVPDLVKPLVNDLLIWEELLKLLVTTDNKIAVTTDDKLPVVRN